MNRPPIKSTKSFGPDELVNKINDRLIYLLGKVFYSALVNYMIENRAVISGSFILQTILDEDWDNSDLDIYIGTKNINSIEYRPKFLSFEPYNVVSGAYQSAFSDIIQVCDYKIIDFKFQLVWIDLNKTKNLWEHVCLTGFEACKNMLYFDRDRKPVLRLTNLWEIINKRTTFSILDSRDFFYRIGKYTARNFGFKPKYNKLLFLEYLVLKYTPLLIKASLHRYDKSKDHLPCPEVCPIRLLYRHLNHRHTEVDGFHTIIVEDLQGELDQLNPRILTPKGLLFMMGNSEIMSCQDTTQYAQIRNNFVKSAEHQIDVRNPDNRYNIKFKPNGPNQRDLHRVPFPGSESTDQKKTKKKTKKKDTGPEFTVDLGKMNAGMKGLPAVRPIDQEEEEIDLLDQLAFPELS